MDRFGSGTPAPSEAAYGALDTPPVAVTALSGLQHVGLMSIYLIYPVLLAQAADSSAGTATAMVSLTLVALAIGTLLQVIPWGPVGSGFLCQPIPSVLYLVPALAAAERGGLPLAFGMTLAAGLLEMSLARVLGRVRHLFAPEIAGLVVLLAGIATGFIGLRSVLAPDGDGTGMPGAAELSIALITLAVMVGLNVWGRGGCRMFCVLIGMAAGYGAGAVLGESGGGRLAALVQAPLLALPDMGHLGWAFDPSLLLPFAVAALAATLKVMANVTTSQQANGGRWTGTDMACVSRGVLADGLGSVVSAGLGAPGLNSSTGAVGLANATGVHSRRVAVAVTAILLALALMPKLGLLLSLMPRPVAGAALLFTSTFIVANGLQMMTAQRLDPRRTLVIGLALVAGFSVDVFPALPGTLPAPLQPVLGTSLVLGTLVGLTLNLLFRIGARQTGVFTVPPAPVDSARIAAFLHTRTAAWGARHEVVARAGADLGWALDAIVSGGLAAGPITVEASFDDFRFAMKLSYEGTPLAPPGTSRLRRLADRVVIAHKAGRSKLELHFDH